MSPAACNSNLNEQVQIQSMAVGLVPSRSPQLGDANPNQLGNVDDHQPFGIRNKVAVRGRMLFVANKWNLSVACGFSIWRSTMQAIKSDQLPAADFDMATSMWDLLGAVERAEHEQMLRTRAEAWAMAHPKQKQSAGDRTQHN